MFKKLKVDGLFFQEEETNLKLEKGDLLAKAEITAAIAKEKGLYLKDVKDIKQEVRLVMLPCCAYACIT